MISGAIIANGVLLPSSVIGQVLIFSILCGVCALTLLFVTANISDAYFKWFHKDREDFVRKIMLSLDEMLRDERVIVWVNGRETIKIFRDAEEETSFAAG